MACGDTVAEQLLRAAGGRTADDPCGLAFCGSEDVIAWSAQARVVFDKVRRAWNELVLAEHPSGDYSASDSVRPGVTAYEDNFHALPDAQALGGLLYAFGGFGNASDAIGQYTASIADGACQLELLNGLLAAKGKPVVHAGPGISSGSTGAGPLGIPWWAWAVAGAAALGAFAYGRFG